MPQSSTYHGTQDVCLKKTVTKVKANDRQNKVSPVEDTQDKIQLLNFAIYQSHVPTLTEVRQVSKTDVPTIANIKLAVCFSTIYNTKQQCYIANSYLTSKRDIFSNPEYVCM